jgi:hypothetical protein
VAMQTIAEFEAVKLAWETARSILAMQRETAKML